MQISRSIDADFGLTRRAASSNASGMLSSSSLMETSSSKFLRTIKPTRSRAPGCPVIFVDDGPNHLAAARQAVEAIRLVHFVADPVWFAMAPEVGGTWLRTRDWGTVARAVGGLIGGDEAAAPIVGDGADG